MIIRPGTMSESTTNPAEIEIRYYRAQHDFARAYGRAWEAVLAAVAGADERFINNEFREAGLAGLCAKSVFNDAYLRLMTAFLGDLPSCRFSKPKRERAIDVFRQIFAIDDEVYAEAQSRLDAHKTGLVKSDTSS